MHILKRVFVLTKPLLTKESTYFFLLLIFLSCNGPVPLQRGLVTDKAMVVSAHPLASAIGSEIMQKGGNAIDAAIAVEFALAVVYPRAGNIGGGGFMVLRMNDGSMDALDYRERAPARASADMYLDSLGQPVPGLSFKGHLAAGVPGTVAGMLAAHEKYGTLPFSQLIQPAINLAKGGFELTQKEAKKLNALQKDLSEFNTVAPESFMKMSWHKGDSIANPDLSETLKRIRDHGRDGFYSGRTAALIVEEMKRGNGIISYEDLKNYRPIWRRPLTGMYRGYKIISMPPPSSGGIALLQMLNMIEDYPLGEWHKYDSRTVHLIAEVERKAFSDRATHLGDPEYHPVPVKELLDPKYLEERMLSFSLDEAAVSTAITAGNFSLVESEETTHYSIIDPMGNAVSATTTLNGSYGSKVVVAGAGFLLNNEMDDFSMKPGVPNAYGLVGGTANAIAPGKRMLSSMTPTIVEKEGQVHMVVGSPGGSTIITSVLQNILNVIDHGYTMQASVSARRYHHQWLPDYLQMESNALPDSTMVLLEAKGHQIKKRSDYGRVEGILVLADGRLEGGADPRGDDAAAGF